MTASVLVFAALYLAIGGLFAGRCRFADARAGWRGQTALTVATLIMALIWPLPAWYAVRHRFVGAGNYR